MSRSLVRHLDEQLESLKAKDLYRSLRLWGGEEQVCFVSNDYLGLAHHPAIGEAVKKSLSLGFGSGASRLLGGGNEVHGKLEEEIAAFKDTEAALSFSSGYATAVGTLAALATRGDVVILDKLSHACLVDGARLSGAEIRVFPHNHLDRLAHLLKWARQERPRAGVFIVTEAVFSMDGDICPLREIVELKNRYGAWLFLDEAHALGVRGMGGRGLAHELGLAAEVEILMGTMGKSLGCSGGFVAGKRKLIDFLINRARSFIYSTAPPLIYATAARAALHILQSEEGLQRMEKLKKNRSLFASAFPQQENESAIFPVRVGTASAALALSSALAKQGLVVPAIRYPTVPRGQARLRISLSATHHAKDIQQLIEALQMHLKTFMLNA